jgi:hypothetical protein
MVREEFAMNAGGIDAIYFMSIFMPTVSVLCTVGFAIAAYLFWNRTCGEKADLAFKLLQCNATKKGEEQ